VGRARGRVRRDGRGQRAGRADPADQEVPGGVRGASRRTG
jgi:hypothetical protein